MYEHSELEQCFECIRQGAWTQFVTLKYPRDGSLKHKGPRAPSAEDAFAEWVYEMSTPNCRDSFDGYVRVTERRDNGDVLFHVLLQGGYSEGFEKHWRWRWFEKSAGAAWERRLDEKIEGLFRYFFFTVRCDIECCVGGGVTGCRAAEDTRST